MSTKEGLTDLNFSLDQLMLGCYGRADPNQTIRLDLDNELEGPSLISSISNLSIAQADSSRLSPDARWFTREELLDILADPKSNIVSKEEATYFNVCPLPSSPVSSHLISQAEFDLRQQPGAAPAEKKKEAKKFRLPPRSAIAGVLTAEWAQGRVKGFGFEADEVLKGRM